MKEILNIKNDFPVLVNNKDLVYLDSGATSLKPYCVLNKMDEYYTKYGVNVNRGVYDLSYQATDEYEKTREVVAEFLNCDSREVVYTKGASNGLNMLALSIGYNMINEGDEIITSELEHHSSFLPWQQIAKNKNATIKFVPLNDEGRITVENFLKVLSNKTKVVCLTHASNVMGYVTPIKEIIKEAHKVGAIVIVDGAQSVPHIKVDVKELDCDFLAFSAHKMLGPTGFGLVYGKYNILSKIKPVEYGGDMIEEVYKDSSIYKEAPYCFETGTPPIAEAIGFSEAIKYLNNIGFDKIESHVKDLTDYCLDKLSTIEGITIYNKTTDVGIITFNINNVHPHDASAILNEDLICVRAGHHCAKLITSWLGVNSTLRACLYIYNTHEDVDKFVESIKRCVEYFKEW